MLNAVTECLCMWANSARRTSVGFESLCRVAAAAHPLPRYSMHKWVLAQHLMLRGATLSGIKCV